MVFDNLYTVREAADERQCSVSTVYHRIRDGEVSAAKIPYCSRFWDYIMVLAPNEVDRIILKPRGRNKMAPRDVDKPGIGLGVD